MSESTPNEVVERFGADIARVKDEVGKMIVGQDDIVDGVLTCLLAGGQALLEGVPGLGKTMLVRTLANALQLDFARIQFTPDLMPADILGTTVLTEGQDGSTRLEFRKGPVFANIVLADEINRATPKTQSAMLEVMQEHTVTVSNKTYVLDEPYFVLATQNPLEMEGTYPLPEAQLDRFLFKLTVAFPSRDDLHAILDRTTGSETPEVTPVLDAAAILRMRKVVRDVAVARHVQDYAIRVLEATHPDRKGAPEKVQRFVRFGGSPRGAQAMLLAAKIHALFEGRFAVSVDDVRWAALPALRHRVILNFEGEAEGVQTDAVIEEILATTKESAG
ncbi:MAG TPA: MoxR family ATPase [Polyangiaceae bacterium LLY-WYZ-15_(1-7)]|nr:AAA family ATPase [Myxococcales bacterium]MAT27724.1 AAA family ATPase [Sandaracinus sp.]HJK91042.1 MoxR family ATPase [Polyangiaceae bacterium LLY-WYZ-15_(1-7)]MBJ71865.1 AAA family ATPase [Sandaracinus sp.]HJK99983.1 MoxR family ATPase [Polyangiaceae bacterium LLY-WYZ-15_(1-7)]